METICKTLNFYNKKLDDILPSLIALLEVEGYKCQKLSLETGETLLQLKKTGFLRGIVGMNTALNVVFHKIGDSFKVEIGEGKWLDKAVVGTISLVFLWPLIPFVGYGIYLQSTLPDKIFEHIENLTTS